MAKRQEGIYTTQGGTEKLIAVRAIVNGVISLAWVKDDKLVSFEPWTNIKDQMLSGPYKEYTI